MKPNYLGYVSELDSVPFSGAHDAMMVPVTGHFSMVKDQPLDSWLLFDDHARMYHPMERVSFLWRVSSPLEGEKKLPRPFVFSDVVGGKLISMGEVLKISYIGGSIYRPLVEGAVESLAVVNQKAFLRLNPENPDRQVERYENDDYLLEMENDGKGNISLRVKPKNSSGVLSLVQVGEDDADLQSLSIDKELGVKIQAQKRKVKEHLVYGESLKIKLESLINTLKIFKVMTPAGVSTGVTPDIIQQLDTLKTGLSDILTE